MEPILGRIIAIMLGLLALVAVAVAGSSAISNARASNVIEGLELIMTNARAQFTQSNNGYTNFTGSNVSTLSSIGVLPGTWMKNSVLTDPWGNGVVLTPYPPNSATITIGGGGSETADQCEKVVMGIKDYVTLTVGKERPFSQSNPPDPVSALNACSDGNSTITILFR